MKKLTLILVALAASYGFFAIGQWVDKNTADFNKSMGYVGRNYDVND